MHVTGSHFLSLNTNEQAWFPFSKTKCAVIFNQHETAMHFLHIVGWQEINWRSDSVLREFSFASSCHFTVSYDAVGWIWTLFACTILGPGCIHIHTNERILSYSMWLRPLPIVWVVDSAPTPPVRNTNMVHVIIMCVMFSSLAIKGWSRWVPVTGPLV